MKYSGELTKESNGVSKQELLSFSTHRQKCGVARDPSFIDVTIDPQNVVPLLRKIAFVDFMLEYGVVIRTKIYSLSQQCSVLQWIFQIPDVRTR